MNEFLVVFVEAIHFLPNNGLCNIRYPGSSAGNGTAHGICEFDLRGRKQSRHPTTSFFNDSDLTLYNYVETN